MSFHIYIQKVFLSASSDMFWRRPVAKTTIFGWHDNAVFEVTRAFDCRILQQLSLKFSGGNWRLLLPFVVDFDFCAQYPFRRFYLCHFWNKKFLELLNFRGDVITTMEFKWFKLWQSVLRKIASHISECLITGFFNLLEITRW